MNSANDSAYERTYTEASQAHRSKLLRDSHAFTDLLWKVHGIVGKGEGEVAEALHRIVRQWTTNDVALSGDERIIGKWLETRINEAADLAGEIAAQDGEVGLLRRVGGV